MEQKSNHHTKQILRTAASLLCLALLSAWTLSGLLARFVSTSESGDSARVAKFVISGSATGDSGHVYIQPGSGFDEDDKIDTFTIQVTNASEVAVKYRFTLDVEGNLPLELEQITDTATTSPSLQRSEDGLEWKTTNAVAPGETSYTFKTIWNNEKKDYRYADGIESIKVTLTAEQED